MLLSNRNYLFSEYSILVYINRRKMKKEYRNNYKRVALFYNFNKKSSYYDLVKKQYWNI